MATEITPIGGEPKTKTTTNVDLSLATIKPWDLPEVAPVDAEGAKAGADAATGALSDMLLSLRTANKDRLEGKISGDVADQIRINSSETAMASGINPSSPAARSLQARDFGLTSMDIKERGIATETQLAGLQQNIAALREERYKFTESLSDSRKAFREQSRQFGASLEQDSLRTQLASRELVLKQAQFNAESNLKVLGLVSDLVGQQMSLQMQASMADISDSKVTQAFDSMITNVTNILKRSNA